MPFGPMIAIFSAASTLRLNLWSKRFFHAGEMLADTLHGDGQAMQLFPLVHINPNVGILTAGRFYVLQFYFLDLARTAGSLPRFGSIGGKAADERLQFRDLGFLLRVIGQHALPHLGGRGHVVIIIAGIDADFAIIQVGHMRADAIQKMAIMRNDDDGTFAGVDYIFQPADSVDIQIVGWLIQQQNVRDRQIALAPAGCAA